MNASRFAAVLGLVLLAGAPCTRASDAPPFPPADAALAVTDGLVQEFMRENHVPGLVYGIVRDGRLVHVGTFGVRDVATGAPVQRDTVFRIASMTKMIAALAILKLRDANALELDDPAARWVPALRFGAASAARLTVRDLLAHTGGFVTDDPWADRHLEMTDAELAALVASGVPSARDVGTAYEYSNLGYALIGRVIASAAQRPAADYVSRELLAPLGLETTHWDYRVVGAERRAKGYRFEEGRWLEEPVLGPGAMDVVGGLLTSAPDYVRLVAFLLDAWTPTPEPSGERILAAASRREIGRGHSFPRTRAPDPRDAASCAGAQVYGLGVHVFADCRFEHGFTHSGGLPGYGSNVLLLPRHRVGIFAFANRTYAPASRLTLRLASHLHDAGWLRSAPVPASAALQALREPVATMYAAARVEAHPELLGDNLLLDREARLRDAELRALQAQLGACRADAEIAASHALGGELVFRCERGRLVATVLLAPAAESRLQRLEFARRD